MLAIRLTRTGKVNSPHYRIVVQEKRSKLNGKAVAVIGHYHPAQPDKQLVINKDEAEQWMKKGAQLSDTVNNLFVKEGILPKNRKISHHFTPKPKEEKVAKPEPKTEEPAEAGEVTAEAAAVEAPTEEAPAETPAEEPVQKPAEETDPAVEA